MKVQRSATALPENGRSRVVLESLSPTVDGGRHPAKRVTGDIVRVEVDAFCDGHDRVACVLRYRAESSMAWQEVRMEPLANDRWWAEFRVEEPGRYRYTVQGWIDVFESWRQELQRRPDTDPDLHVAFALGARMIRSAADRARGPDARQLFEAAEVIEGAADTSLRKAAALEPRLAQVMARLDERHFATDYDSERRLTVDPKLAEFGAWYEFFPRSCDSGDHARLADCERQLAYVAGMGFDIVYLPPIHPIGKTFRKGPNNVLQARPEDVGSPWGIGGEAGGHKDIHPDLGTLDDFGHFLKTAGTLGLKVALDLAFQCSPDHPYVRTHPDWFRHRPDGSIRYAENPPKKYQDIYPFDFESEDWQGLWRELRSVVGFWIEQGVTIFRVDNPHTKAFAFWEWLISDVKQAHPEVLFLSEAFTRPRVMHRLAKIGFSQSYTYFTWRNTQQELTQYLTELTSAPGSEYFRPNLWPNTPDILPEYLQFGGRPAFMSRLILAATLSSSYGIYGPAFELSEAEPRDPGGEEYLDSEKYEIRQWDLERPDSLRDLIARVNRIRRENVALQSNGSLCFHEIDNEQLIAYSKTTADGENIVLVLVNLDPHHRQSGWVQLPLERFGIEGPQPYQMHDLLSGARYLWHGARNYVELDPQGAPAHIFRLRRRVRREQDFDYFM